MLKYTNLGGYPDGGLCRYYSSGNVVLTKKLMVAPSKVMAIMESAV